MKRTQIIAAINELESMTTWTQQQYIKHQYLQQELKRVGGEDNDDDTDTFPYRRAS